MQPSAGANLLREPGGRVRFAESMLVILGVLTAAGLASYSIKWHLSECVRRGSPVSVSQIC